ncbi:MAG: ribosomal protein S18-alanine N-acetyltransferase [Gemmatimonadetes bacterium]|nr:ribosomal protein S18-alanine N-acetyltransferase [Gemmatimonadota bacterium]NNF12625.1 ribosomal protein S18-alanine N-acetyltransferase [Gemmatimonadota bacterium]
MGDVTTDAPGLPHGIHVRPLRREDIEAVVAIESEAFTTPWQASTFEGLLGRDGIELLVMIDVDDGVIGYAVLWVILDQGELANLALTTNRRGAGLGGHLLRHVLDRARERGVEKLFLEVRASNARAIDLYRNFGFEDVGIRRAYYESPKEDARVMLATFGS